MGLKNFAVYAFILLLGLPQANVYAEEWDDLLRFSEPQKNIQKFNLNSQKRNQLNSAPAQKLSIVKRLDQEILLLRAERSMRNGSAEQVARYVQQLDKQQILPPFISRVDALKKYIAQHANNTVVASRYVQQIDFPMDDENSVVAIVLPASGAYEQPGKRIQEAIQKGLKEAGFKGKLVALDSNLYATAFDLWELLKYYEPDFIFGPLSKEKIEDWKQLKTGISTLYFNDSSFLGVGEFSLSPSRTAGLEQVFQVLQDQQISRVVVLADNSENSLTLAESFQQAWLQFNNDSSYSLHIIEGNVGKSINQVLGVEASKNRASWLKNSLNLPLQTEPRRRQDTQAVISFVPQQQAIQIAPYLPFIATQQPLLHIWYPSKTPSAKFLDFNRDAWQSTLAIVPLTIQLNNHQNNSRINLSSKDGLFYALGRVAVEIVKKSTASNMANRSVDSVELTTFGSYVQNASGQFHLLPVVYWANKGVFEPYEGQPLP